MTDEEIRATVLEVKGRTYPDWNVNIDRYLEEFATRFLAAISSKAEPDYRSIADAVVGNLESRKQVISLDFEEELVEEIMQEMADTIRDGFTSPAINFAANSKT